jgi:hypothetical protein
MIIIGQKQCKIKVKSTPFLPALKGGVSWSFSDEHVGFYQFCSKNSIVHGGLADWLS